MIAQSVDNIGAELRERAKRIRELSVVAMQSAVDNAIAIGAELSAARKHLKRAAGNPGDWKRWVTEDCKMHMKAAYTFIRVHEIATTKEGGTEFLRSCSMKALELLTRPSKVDDLNVAMGVARHGYRITTGTAEAIVREHRHHDKKPRNRATRVVGDQKPFVYTPTETSALEVCMGRVRIALMRQPPSKHEAVSAIDSFLELDTSTD